MRSAILARISLAFSEPVVLRYYFARAAYDSIWIQSIAHIVQTRVVVWKVPVKVVDRVPLHPLIVRMKYVLSRDNYLL